MRFLGPCFLGLPPAFPALLAALGNSLALAVAAALLAAGCLTLPARGAIVVDATGTSAAGNPVAFRATLAITGDELAIDLENISPVRTSEPADVLASFYFDLVRNGERPTLNYRSAAGQVFELLRKQPDQPVIYTPPAKAGGKGTATPGLGLSDLVATKRGDFTWQFRQLDPAYEPLAGFGLGTVGNSTLSPANFDPKVVDGNDFAISRGDDIEPRGNLPGTYLVRELVRFRLGLVGGPDGGPPGGWTEADIGHRFTFGLGTSPESVIVVTMPEPAGGPVVGTAAVLGGAVLTRRWAIGRRRQAARRVGQTGCFPASGTGSGSPPAGVSASLSLPAGLA